MLNIQMDKLVIGRFFSTEELAIYTNAAREMPLTIVGASITVVLLPKLVRLFKNRKNKQAINLWNDSIVISYIFICFFAVVLIVFAPEIITLLYSAKYLPGVTAFRIYSLLMVFSVTYFGIVLNAIGRTKLILYSTILAFLVNTVLNVAFYYLFGFIGPAIATFVSIAVVRISQLIATSKVISMPFKQIFPWKQLGLITLFNILAGGLVYGVKIILPLQLYTGQLAESIILGAVWLGIYTASVFKLVKTKWNALNSDTLIETA